MIPVVLGPEDRHYVIDHHHLARALHEEGVENILVTVVANLRTLEPDSFWFVLDNRNWMHTYDDEGRLLAGGRTATRWRERAQEGPALGLAGKRGRVRPRRGSALHARAAPK